MAVYLLRNSSGTCSIDDALLGEAADLVYHLIVLLHARGLTLADVALLLEQRHAQVADAAE